MTKQTTGKPVVLTVDDNPVNLEELAFVLSDAGFEVVRAEDGKTAVERAQTIRPDLILLDVLLPDTDGFALCAKFKQDAHTAQVPVLFMTALDDTANKVKGFAGARDHPLVVAESEERAAREGGAVGAHFRARDGRHRHP
jgi:formate hydrogenlyase transcriptional activator